MTIRLAIEWTIVVCIVLPFCILGVGVMVIGSLLTLIGYGIIHICSLVSKILDNLTT